MAIKKIIDKRGRELYHDGKKFTTRKAFINDYFLATGRGKKYIFQIDDLTPKEKQIYRAKERARNSFRYKGKFVSREMERYLKALGYKPGSEVSYNQKKRTNKGLTPGQFETAKKELSYFQKDSFIKNGEYYTTTRGDELNTTKTLINAIKKGDTVLVEIDGELFSGHDAVRALMMWEMNLFSDTEADAVRITHRIQHDKKKGIYEINVDNSQIDLFENTP